MITFVSIFLGLVLGPQTVSVVVADPEVASVVFALDGRTVARLDAPPWATEIDLGPKLVPHELIALGVDAEGTEIARARQWINLPRVPTETRLTVASGEDGAGSIASLSWQSLETSEQPTLSVTLDGEPLGFTDPAAIALPALIPEELHFLRAEVRFDSQLPSVAELTLGGDGYFDQVTADLTAIPVKLVRGGELPALDALAGWFEKGGEPLRVVAAERELADIVIVADPTAREDLLDWYGNEASRARAARRSAPGARSGKDGGASDWQLEFLWPFSLPGEDGDQRYELFPHSRPLSADDGRLLQMLVWARPPADLPPHKRLADAVAVAGVSAAAGRHRRVVILLLGSEQGDDSDLTPKLVSHYLEQLQVPLVVWSTDADPSPEAEAWGRVIDVSNRFRLEGAWKRVRKELGEHRIVWIEGVHLPHEIRLTDAAEGIILVR